MSFLMATTKFNNGLQPRIPRDQKHIGPCHTKHDYSTSGSSSDDILGNATLLNLLYKCPGISQKKNIQISWPDAYNWKPV